MRAGRAFGRLLLTTVRQPRGAPILDGGTTTDAEGRHYGSIVVRVWRTLAIVVGWRGARCPDPSRWHLRRRSPPRKVTIEGTAASGPPPG